MQRHRIEPHAIEDRLHISLVRIANVRALRIADRHQLRIARTHILHRALHLRNTLRAARLIERHIQLDRRRILRGLIDDPLPKPPLRISMPTIPLRQLLKVRIKPHAQQ